MTLMIKVAKLIENKIASKSMPFLSISQINDFINFPTTQFVVSRFL